jgi:hypothetical protein
MLACSWKHPHERVEGLPDEGRREETHSPCAPPGVVDLSRRASVHAIVAKSFAGHATDRMLEHYSTAALAEQRHAVGTVKSGYAGGYKLDSKKKPAT